MPFINKFDEWKSAYKVPTLFCGYDSTSSQKHIAELAWQTGEAEVTPLGFDGAKKFMYLNSAKLLMSKGLLQIPKGIDASRTRCGPTTCRTRRSRRTSFRPCACRRSS
jgi:hypothetical protein